ncbi:MULTISPECIES: hypothetical protein [unclassified Streptomyces]|uniref:hypothetical protein n=1 Tax=unclassified Streptomyces TaxID=2593676 RepID=UPI001661CF80|nr:MULTISPECIES: hypothetical protein [unclassified Streptomyces]MBD0843652.1 hypothetical protein [Streptomyces sp. TRM68416]
MDIASDLALIDRLCARDHPLQHGRTDEDTGGGPYHQAVLGLRQWPSPDDCYAYEAAIAERLTARWGEPSRWGTVTLVERSARGEPIPEPWAMLSALATELLTWKDPDTGRWVTMTVLDGDTEPLPQVFAVVTTTDPP